MTSTDGRAVRSEYSGDLGFDPATLGGLPEPARRWLTHAVAPGAVIAGSAELSTRGEIKIGRWQPFRASELLVAPSSYVWAATFQPRQPIGSR